MTFEPPNAAEKNKSKRSLRYLTIARFGILIGWLIIAASFTYAARSNLDNYHGVVVAMYLMYGNIFGGCILLIAASYGRSVGPRDTNRFDTILFVTSGILGMLALLYGLAMTCF
jgi:hypothetical protein